MTVVQRNGITVGNYVNNALGQRIAKTTDGKTARFTCGGAIRMHCLQATQETYLQCLEGR